MSTASTPSGQDLQSELVRLRRERDFYRALLELGRKQQVEPFLEEALSLVIAMARARRGYFELRDDSQPADDPARWWIAVGCSSRQIEEIRKAFSRGVIAEALATGRTIATASALDDPRFQERGSVRLNQLEAVLCAPIGSDPPLGVVYLQDREEPGPFAEQDVQRVEAFAQHLAVFADRLLVQQRRERELDATKDLRQRLKVEGLVGRGAALAQVLRQVAMVAPIDVSVLLTGASGTGKTHLARVIHDNSPRASRPFVELNCAALPEGLVENELFGALAGAHSTATRRIEGKILAAEGGTLFLDEVSELPLSAQAKLLQLLQSREYYPLGGARPQRANVRIIAATNVDLQAAVAEKRFREDLFYRLQVLPVRVPTLAERKEDIAALVTFFCRDACERHRLPRIEPSRGLLRAAESAEWPGNVRQLAHAVEAAVVRAAGDGVLVLERSHLFPDLPAGTESESEPLTFQQATRVFQEQLLRKTLEETGWNIAEAAHRLDLARSHVYNLIRAHGLERKTSQNPGKVPSP